jgi:hypothetical protein
VPEATRGKETAAPDFGRVIMQNVDSRALEIRKKTAERSKAMAEYQAEAKARAVKTARLRELRLAKEEADRLAALEAEAAKPKRGARSAKSPKKA